MAASATAAVCTFARCASEVIGSPRRNNAFPPSATRIRIASVPESGNKDGFDRVHPILCLLEGDVHFGIKHLRGDFHGGETELLVYVTTDLGFQIVKGGQAMHE